jgi:DNA-binding CsgD family transcriptional regulator
VSIVPADTRAEMVRLYVEEELSTAAVGRRLFWSATTVRAILADEGVERRANGGWGTRPDALTQEQLDEVTELRQQGRSTAEIGRILGIHRTTVSLRLGRAGIPVRSRSEAQRLLRRRRVAQYGTAGLTDKQAAALRFIEANEYEGKDRPTTDDVARALGISLRNTRDALHQLVAYGLVSYRRRKTGRVRFNEWKRTKLSVRDVVEYALAPPPQRRSGDVWLAIEPFRDWLERQVDMEQRLMLHISTDEDKGIAPTPGAARVATRLHLDERRLYALRFVQRSVTLSMADQCLLHAGDGTTLEDLWPELGCDEEVARLPRSYQQRDRQLEAAA